jgi:hypothetical protein
MTPYQFIVNVNSALASSHYVDIGNVAEVSKALAGSIFRAEVSVVTAFLIIILCTLFLLVQNGHQPPPPLILPVRLFCQNDIYIYIYIYI